MPGVRRSHGDGCRPQLGTAADGRQSPAAFDICRGVARVLQAHGFAAVSEVALANGRRADVAGISDSGEIWIVEIKSCLEDFRTDQKWPEYREFCDRLFFAVAPDFPREVLPRGHGPHHRRPLRRRDRAAGA